MPKRSIITNITPLPPSIPRDIAVAHLHDHTAMIELNPLVIRHVLTDPPSSAAKDEAEAATWYEITDTINYLPGGVIKGQVSYKACFYNLPCGLQTHVFAPGGVDIRSKWSICGTMPGEPKEPQELGLEAPREGLYIKEEIDLRCNFFLSAFVKRNLKKSHEVVAERIISKAHLEQGNDSESPMSPQLSARSGPATVASSTFGPGLSKEPHYLENMYSFPSRCACEGGEHRAECRFASQQGLSQSPEPSPFVQPGRSVVHSNGPTPPLQGFQTSESVPELYGSPRAEACLCTGALHEEGCGFYPGLRVPPLPGLAFPESPTTSVQQTPDVLYSRTYIPDTFEVSQPPLERLPEIEPPEAGHETTNTSHNGGISNQGSVLNDLHRSHTVQYVREWE